MIADHLVGVRDGALAAGVREVVAQVVESGADRGELAAELGEDGGCCGVYAAGVVVQQDVGDVVPVLGLRREWSAAVLARRKPARPVTMISAVCSTPPSRASSSWISMSRPAKTGTAEVRGAQRATAFEHDGRAGGSIVEIGEQLELDYRDAACSVGAPPPHSLRVRLELGVAQRLFESPRVVSCLRRSRS